MDDARRAADEYRQKKKQTKNEERAQEALFRTTLSVSILRAVVVGVGAVYYWFVQSQWLAKTTHEIWPYWGSVLPLMVGFISESRGRTVFRVAEKFVWLVFLQGRGIQIVLG